MDGRLVGQVAEDVAHRDHGVGRRARVVGQHPHPRVLRARGVPAVTVLVHHAGRGEVGVGGADQAELERVGAAEAPRLHEPFGQHLAHEDARRQVFGRHLATARHVHHSRNEQRLVAAELVLGAGPTLAVALVLGHLHQGLEPGAGAGLVGVDGGAVGVFDRDGVAVVIERDAMTGTGHERTGLVLLQVILQVAAAPPAAAPDRARRIARLELDPHAVARLRQPHHAVLLARERHARQGPRRDHLAVHLGHAHADASQFLVIVHLVDDAAVLAVEPAAREFRQVHHQAF